MDPSTLNHREHAILQAVAAGRAHLLVNCASSLLVDGCWCDATAVNRLLADGWICAAHPATAAERVPAQLTEAAAESLELKYRQSA